MKAWWRGSRRSGRGDRRRRCPRVLVTLASTDDGDNTGLFSSPGEGDVNISQTLAESSCFIDISTPEEENLDTDVNSSGNEDGSKIVSGMGVVQTNGSRSRNVLQSQTSIWEDEPHCSNGSENLTKLKDKNTDKNFITLSHHGFYIGESGSDLSSLVAADEDLSEDRSTNISFSQARESSDATVGSQVKEDDRGSVLLETSQKYPKTRPRSYTDSVSQSLINRKNRADSYSKLISPDPPDNSEKLSDDGNLASDMEEGKIVNNIGDCTKQLSKNGNNLSEEIKLKSNQAGKDNFGSEVISETILANGDPVGPGRKEECDAKKVADPSLMKLPARRFSPKGLTKLKIPSTLDHLDVALPHIHSAPPAPGKTLPQMFLSPNLTPSEASSGVSSREGRKFSFPILRRHSHTVKSY